MPESIPGRESEEKESTVYSFVTVMGSRSGPDGRLTVVTESGRELRITGIRHPGSDVSRMEIVVAEGEA